VAFRYGESVVEFYERSPWEQAQMIATIRAIDRMETVRIQEAAEDK